LVNNYWAQQAARQLKEKQKELNKKGSLTPVARNTSQRSTTNKNTRYFFSTKQGGCGCGK